MPGVSLCNGEVTLQVTHGRLRCNEESYAQRRHTGNLWGVARLSFATERKIDSRTVQQRRKRGPEKPRPKRKARRQCETPSSPI